MKVAASRRGRRRAALPAPLDRRFEAVVFVWHGTAVLDAQADATALRTLVEELCALGLDLGIVAAAEAGDVDGRLRARPAGPGRLWLCVNHGSEVFVADSAGLRSVYRREATPEEEAGLDAAATATVGLLAHRGVRAEVVAGPRNRRTVGRVESADPPQARGTELAAVDGRLGAAGPAGMREAVELAEEAARNAGLADPRVTSDGKRLEIGLTDGSDSARWLLREAAGRGIESGLVLVVGAELGPLGGLPGGDSRLLVPEAARSTVVSVGSEPDGVPAGVLALGGGPDRFVEVLADQLERRRRADVPDVDDDPAWTIAVDGLDSRLERVHESQLTIADGRIGTRGAPLLAHPEADPGVLALGVYAGEGPETQLVPCPEWASLPGRLRTPSEGTPQRNLRGTSEEPRRNLGGTSEEGSGPPLRRRLDLRTGLLREDGPVDALRFSSLARPGTVVLRAEGDGRRLPRAGRRVLAARGVAAALADVRRGRRLERIGAYASGEDEARADLARAEEAGFERLLVEHRSAWSRRWEQADIVVEGDPELQRAVRFTLFHLMASVPDEGEAPVGARGLSGPGYRGHVFWDSDVFVLPFLAATHPAAARAMLEYRIRRLPAAREAAVALGRRGARFPWESADTGFDVTPSHAHLPTGEIARIRTGEREEHIVADVAWAACCYVDWTGDEAFAAGPGRELVVETARYWASRIRLDPAGEAHLYGVIGPDEYHEPVDDNAFTNVIARWNLRRGAELTDREDERRSWLHLADALVDGYDPMSGLYEQFAGFFELEPLVIADIAPQRPIAADLLLGAERTRAAQVLKQADVLMLHHLLPDEVAPGSLLPNLDFYEPRTAHGSSLSPAIHAALHARAGRFREALASLRIAAGIDLDDLTGTTASGLHLATMGGLWQALVFGFAGVRPRGQALHVEPRLPPDWGALEVRLRFRGAPLRLRIDRDGVSLDAGRELELRPLDYAWEVVFR